MILDAILNPIFGPLLGLPSFWTVVIISFIIALIMIIIYKYTTNQVVMKELKGQLKGYQKQLKEHRSDPSKMKEINKKMMEVNVKFFKHSMKSMFITWIPIIIIFGWMNAHLGYYPILPGQEFSTTVSFEEGIDGEVELITPLGVELLGDKIQEIEDEKASWKLRGITGEHTLEYRFEDEKVLKEVLITEERSYKNPIKTKKGFLSFGGDHIPDESNMVQISISNERVYPLRLFGLKLSWFWTYFIFTFVFNMILRKVMKVY